MPEESLEWEMVVELMDYLDDMTDSSRSFVKSLYDNLSPHDPFLEQQSDKQLQWLYSLYERHVCEDEEAARDMYE